MDTKALRQKILDLAIRGKLVPQDPNDEPASVLLERIRAEKQQMVKEGKLKAKDIKGDTIIFKGEDNLHYEKFADGTVKCIEDEIPFEVPEGWEWCRLNAIATFELGKTLDTAKNTGTYKPYLRSVNVRWNSVDLSNINCMKFEPDELARYSVKKGDLLICEGGDVGRSCVWEKDEEMYYQNALHRVRFYMNINPYFYMYIMMYYANSGKLQEICKGVTIKHLTRTTLLTLLFPLPPQNEGLNIISKIWEFDSLLQNIEKNKNDISYLTSYAKSKILDLAIRGKLVPQDPNDEPVSVLLERIRAEKEELIKQGKIKRDKKESIIFRDDDNSYYEKIGKEITCIDNKIPFELPDKWSWCRLGNICASIQYGLSNSAESEGTHKLLRITDIQNNMVDWDTVPYTTVPNAENYLLKTDDIVFARTGATVGKSFLITALPYNSVYASYLIRIRLMDGISPSYIYDFFNSPCYWEQITKQAIGIGQPNCNGTTLSNLLIPVPTISMQCNITEIVRKTLKHILTIEQSLR